MKSFVLAVVLALPVSAAVPETIARIVKSDEGKITITNNGSNPISAVVIRHGKRADDLIWVDFYEHPLVGGGLQEADGWRDAQARDLEIAAVVFADGHSIGGPIDRGDGQDLVAAIFTRRGGEAKEWARWKQILSQNDLAGFLTSAGHMAVEATSHNPEEDGIIFVQSDIKSWAGNIDQARKNGESDDAIRAELAGKLAQHSAAAVSAARRVAQ